MTQVRLISFPAQALDVAAAAAHPNEGQPPALGGVLIERGCDGWGYAVATSGAVLVGFRWPMPDDEPRTSARERVAWIPAYAARDALRAIAEPHKDVRLALARGDDGWLGLETEDGLCVAVWPEDKARLAAFPGWRSALPKAPGGVTTDVDLGLLARVHRALIGLDADVPPVEERLYACILRDPDPKTPILVYGVAWHGEASRGCESFAAVMPVNMAPTRSWPEVGDRLAGEPEALP